MRRNEKRSLQSCLIAEYQAIAIYRAECALLRRTSWTHGRRTTYMACLNILDEELKHKHELERWLGRAPGPLNVAVNQCVGYALGLLLSFLPSALSWRVHAWAERAAARIYEEAGLAFRADHPARRALSKAAHNEWSHAARFDLLTRVFR